MENFKVKNRLVYGGYIALLWLLGGLAFYYILNNLLKKTPAFYAIIHPTL